MTGWLQSLKEFFRAFAPGRFPYARMALAATIGLAGALLFLWLKLPLPWMLGPLVACLIASLLTLPVAAPGVVRAPMMMVVGVLLGSGFTPALIQGMTGWIPSLLGLVLFVLVAALACVTYFRKVAKFDLATAYFAGMPGGIIEMVLLGGARGGDTRVIALIHSSRILLIVLSLPIVLYLATGETITGGRSLGTSILHTAWTDEVWIIGTAIVGAALGSLLRLPSPLLMGPMVASAAIHLTGISDYRPPWEIVALAQLILGVNLGCRFVGSEPREILRILRLALGSTMILVSLTVTFALGVSQLIGQPMVDLLLAYSPGGLTETSIIALSLHVEVAFVACHHVVRVFLVMASAGMLFRFVDHRKAKPPGT